jgi:hypothetical protein
MTFSNETWSTPTAKVLNGVGAGSNSMANSGTAGYITGGSVSSNSTSYIQKLVFSNDSVSTIGNRLSVAKQLSSGFANKGVAGYIALGFNTTGGLSFTAVGSVDKIAFSNDSVSAFTLGTLSGYVPYSIGNEGSI